MQNVKKIDRPLIILIILEKFFDFVIKANICYRMLFYLHWRTRISSRINECILYSLYKHTGVSKEVLD